MSVFKKLIGAGVSFTAGYLTGRISEWYKGEKDNGEKEDGVREEPYFLNDGYVELELDVDRITNLMATYDDYTSGNIVYKGGEGEYFTEKQKECVDVFFSKITKEMNKHPKRDEITVEVPVDYYVLYIKLTIDLPTTSINIHKDWERKD